jgi:hypothetical protein
VRSARKLPNARRVFSQEFSVDEFGQSRFGAVRCPESATGVNSMKNKARRFGKSVFFFFHANEQNKNVTPNS